MMQHEEEAQTETVLMPKNPVGRPREFGEIVSLRLPVYMHDALSREALARSESLSVIIREHLHAALVEQHQFRISKLASKVILK